MRFQTKVFTFFLLIALLSSSLVVAFMWWPTQKLFFDMMSTNVLSIAATVGAMLDPEEHNKIQDRADQDSPAYEKIEYLMRRARDANRRRDLYVKYIYTMRPYVQNPSTAQFVVDAEEDAAEKSNVGDVYKSDAQDYQFRVAEFQTEDRFLTDQWGTWLTANAPLRDARGNAVASVGVDVSADYAIQQLRKLLWGGAAAVGISVIIAIILASLASRRIARPLLEIRQAVERYTRGDYLQPLAIRSRDEFGEVGEALNTMAAGLQQREDLKSALARYVSEDILNEIIYAGKTSDLYSNRKKVTILFADVRGFTSLSEQLSPEETVSLLNEYFEKMIEAVFKNNGHLNKFMGDGLMALFGALRDDPFQEENAIKAAIAMRAVLGELKEKWSASEDTSRHGLTDLRIGIGINTGLAIVGNIGSKQRMEYTAIGDAVNLAARLEHATREHNVDILVSEYSYVATRSRFAFESVGDISLKGKAQTVRTYTIKSDAILPVTS